MTSPPIASPGSGPDEPATARDHRGPVGCGDVLPAVDGLAATADVQRIVVESLH